MTAHRRGSLPDFYVCPRHTGTGGWEPCCNCGGWEPDDPDYGRLCTEAGEADCVRRLRGAHAELMAVPDYRKNLAKARSELIRALLGQFGWSCRGVAKELGISEQAVSRALRRDQERAYREYCELVARYDSDPEYRAHIKQIAEEVEPP